MRTKRRRVTRLLGSYVQVCSCLLQVDIDTMQRISADKPHLTSPKNLKALTSILRFSFEVPIWALLRRSYKADVEGIWLTIMHSFMASPADGMRHLTQFAKLVARRIHTAPTFNMLFLHALRIAEQASFLIVRTPGRLSTTNGLSPPWLRLRRNALQLFRNVEEDIQESVRKQSSSVSLDFNRDLMLVPASMLSSIGQLHDDLTVELVREFVGSTPIVDTDTSALLASAWKFQLLKKYVSRGRMELRVFGIETMSQELVSVWKQYNASPSGLKHPVMQFLAQFLLEEKIIDYIIGVDSHPQLISRSGNIVGFLVVTNTYTTKETDRIWETVVRSPDPRVVAATLSMLMTIVNLMQMPELLYFCQKLSELPAEAFDIEMLKFMREIFDRVINKPQEWARSESKMSPFQLCMRLIRQTSPTVMALPGMNIVYEEASRELVQLASLVTSPSDRLELYNSCSDDIKKKGKHAASNMHAIFLILQSRTAQEDLDFIVEEFKLTRLAIEDFCSFVKESKQTIMADGTRRPLGAAMNSRLDLIFYLIRNRPHSLPADLDDALWESLVGQNALDTLSRDTGWHNLADLARQQGSQHPFLDRCISHHFPKIDPTYFTDYLYEFARQSIEYRLRVNTLSKAAGGKPMYVPGADMLWHIILLAPKCTIEYPAAKFACEFVHAEYPYETGTNGLYRSDPCCACEPVDKPTAIGVD